MNVGGSILGFYVESTGYSREKSLMNRTYHNLLRKSLWFLKLTFGPEVPILGKLAWGFNYNYGSTLTYSLSTSICILYLWLVPKENLFKFKFLPCEYVH